MRKTKNQSDLGYCLKNGVTIYPIRQHRDTYKNGKQILKKGHWYIQVNNNGKLVTYPKSLGTGLRLNGKDFATQQEKTITYWAKLIEENKTK